MAGDGDWFWYAELLRKGVRLYQNLDFTQQPFFVLETAWFQDVFGEGWIASRLPAILSVIALSTAIFLLALRSSWSDLERAVLIVGVFFVGIRPEWYRFDDYHVPTDSFILFSAILALSMERYARLTTRLTIASALGIFAGLAITTRLNDGASLFFFSALCVLALNKRGRLSALAIYGFTFVVTVVLIVALTGDSMATWGVVSILQAGSLKGGNSLFLLDPILIILTASKYLWSAESLVVLATLFIALSWTFLVRPLPNYVKSTAPIRIAIGLFIIGACAFLLRSEIGSGGLLYALLAVLLYAAYALALYVIGRFLLHITISPSFVRWQNRELFLLLPLILIVSYSFSSGGNFFDLFMPVAVFILIIAVIEPFPLANPQIRALIVATTAVMGISGITFKAMDPSSWISYKASPIFVNRELIKHPVYGPMIVDKTLLTFVDRICEFVNDGSTDQQLLSIPFPYANYYCNITPWHNFVQTWFDTSSRSVVDELASQLEFDPPRWILYQRQIGTLEYHELIYNDGHRLPQHSLDDFIMSKVDQGEWRVVDRESYGLGSDWLLLNTQTTVSEGRNLLSNPTGLQGLRDWRVAGTSPVWSVDTKRGRLIVTNHQGSSEESMVSRNVTFARTGPVAISTTVEASRVNTYVGGFGYSIDLFDETTSEVVGALGRSNADDPVRTYTFGAVASAHHRYLLRFHFSATDGRVAFGNVRINYRADGKSSPFDLARPQKLSDSLHAPTWSTVVDASGNGSFVVHAVGDVPVESTLLHTINFQKPASVTVQVEVGATTLDAAGAFGYVVDLFDKSQDKVVASLGVPARISPLRMYSFSARVSPDDDYRIRLRFKAASGDVRFSRLKVEYGTIPTRWSN